MDGARQAPDSEPPESAASSPEEPAPGADSERVRTLVPRAKPPERRSGHLPFQAGALRGDYS